MANRLYLKPSGSGLYLNLSGSRIVHKRAGCHEPLLNNYRNVHMKGYPHPQIVRHLQQTYRIGAVTDLLSINREFDRCNYKMIGLGQRRKKEF